ncbi:MAG: alginate export family protein, partial [Gemmatimonadetes bacterium]|nr:alginate export family protein [Gemmatimonadota bacterium]
FWLWSPAAAPSWAVQVGRQDFDEEREWLYDENLDAVRVHWRRSTARVEGSLSTRWNSTSSRLDGWTNAILFAEREVRDRHVLALWGIHRANGSDTPTWIGLRSSGRLSRRLRHWVDTASLTGNLDGVRRSAYAIDAGLRYRAIQKNRTEFTVGWARGSGGGDSRETFHSTGLGDNNARFGGVTGFKYYGELLEPELVNLEIVTAAAGFRPTRSSSIDLIFHDYRQVAASRRDFDTALESRPLGLDPDLGSEWNVIVGFEELRQVDIEYDFAYFTPGRAFPESAEAATVHRFKMRFKF